MDNLKSFIMSFVPSSPAFYFAVESPSALTIITSIVLPVMFFIASKAIDVLVQIHIKNRKAKK